MMKLWSSMTESLLLKFWVQMSLTCNHSHGKWFKIHSISVTVCGHIVDVIKEREKCNASNRKIRVDAITRALKTFQKDLASFPPKILCCYHKFISDNIQYMISFISIVNYLLEIISNWCLNRLNISDCPLVWILCRHLFMGAVQWSKVKNGWPQNGLGIKNRTKNFNIL